MAGHGRGGPRRAPRWVTGRRRLDTEQRLSSILESALECFHSTDVPMGVGLGVPLDWDFINTHKRGSLQAAHWMFGLHCHERR